MRAPRHFEARRPRRQAEQKLPWPDGSLPHQRFDEFGVDRTQCASRFVTVALRRRDVLAPKSLVSHSAVRLATAVHRTLHLGRTTLPPARPTDRCCENRSAAGRALTVPGQHETAEASAPCRAKLVREAGPHLGRRQGRASRTWLRRWRRATGGTIRRTSIRIRLAFRGGARRVLSCWSNIVCRSGGSTMLDDLSVVRRTCSSAVEARQLAGRAGPAASRGAGRSTAPAALHGAPTELRVIDAVLLSACQLGMELLPPLVPEDRRNPHQHAPRRFSTGGLVRCSRSTRLSCCPE